MSFHIVVVVIDITYFACFSVQLRNSVRKFLAEKLAPYADEIDKKNEFAGMRVSNDLASNIKRSIIICNLRVALYQILSIFSVN